MSYSSLVKDEVCRVQVEKPCCQRAELLGAYATHYQQKGTPFKVVTRNTAFTRRFLGICKQNGLKDITVEIKKNHKNRNGYFYCLKSESFSFWFLKKENTEIVEKNALYHLVYQYRKCCQKAFMRGLFLAGGAVGNPNVSYRIQIMFDSYAGYQLALPVLEAQSLATKFFQKGHHIVHYCKDAEKLVHFLQTIGAYHAMMQLENIRIMKELKNNVNRVVNCETANLEKIVNASFQQVTDILYIQNTIGLEKLPEKLKAVAILRLAHQEASLKELGELLEPPMGKSGVNHRLKKIQLFAMTIRDGKGEQND